MTVKSVHRQYGLSEACVSLDSARRRVEPEDIAFAVLSRPRMGWQTIAKIRGVNESDLRAACAASLELAAGDKPPAPSRAGPSVATALGQRAAPQAPAPRKRRYVPRPPKPRAPRIAFRQMQVLAAIGAGAQTHEQISARVGIAHRNSISIVNLLRRKDLLRGTVRQEAGFRLTEAGTEALAAWSAAK